MSPRLPHLLLSSQSDERLVSLAQAGHERAFVAIVERYRPELHALARRLCPDGRAEDVLQQAFLSAFTALRSGADVTHLRGWLYQIVRNTAHRSRAPRWVPLDVQTASVETVEDVVQQRAQAMSALGELARLPARQRQAMIDTVLGGMARAEVASTMGLSEGAVRQLVHRARRTLRTAVTAVTPWPLARWLAAGGPAAAGAPAAPGAADLAAGAGAATSGGIALKLGTLLASGTLLTGVAAVNLHIGRRHAPGPHPRAAAHARTSGDHAHPLVLASVASPALSVSVSRPYRPGLAVVRPIRTVAPTVGAGLSVWHVAATSQRSPARHHRPADNGSGQVNPGSARHDQGGFTGGGENHRSGGDGGGDGSGAPSGAGAGRSDGGHGGQSGSDHARSGSGSTTGSGTRSQSGDGSFSRTGSGGDGGAATSGDTGSGTAGGSGSGSSSGSDGTMSGDSAGSTSGGSDGSTTSGSGGTSRSSAGSTSRTGSGSSGTSVTSWR